MNEKEKAIAGAYNAKNRDHRIKQLAEMYKACASIVRHEMAMTSETWQCSATTAIFNAMREDERERRRNNANAD